MNIINNNIKYFRAFYKETAALNKQRNMEMSEVDKNKINIKR